jgi:hypothetical protein
VLRSLDNLYLQPRSERATVNTSQTKEVQLSAEPPKCDAALPGTKLHTPERLVVKAI